MAGRFGQFDFGEASGRLVCGWRGRRRHEHPTPDGQNLHGWVDSVRLVHVAGWFDGDLDSAQDEDGE